MKIYEMICYLKQEKDQKKIVEFIKENQKCHDVLKYLHDPFFETGLKEVDLDTIPQERWDVDMLITMLINYLKEYGLKGDKGVKKSYVRNIYERGHNNKKWKWVVNLIATKGYNNLFELDNIILSRAGLIKKPLKR